MGISAMIFGGNWDNGSNSGSRCSNWNNSPTNSDNNIGVAGACEDMKDYKITLCHRYGMAGGPSFMWSAVLSCLGEYIFRFGKTTSNPWKQWAKVASGSKKVCYG
jgi:hypothetical protein